MSIWTIVFLVCMGISVLFASAAYRSDKKHGISWDFEDISFGIFLAFGFTTVVMLISGVILLFVADESEGTIEDSYKAELIPMVDSDQELLVADGKDYEFSYLRENGSPVKRDVWSEYVTLIDYDGDPYVVEEQWMGPDNLFPWEWQRWNETRYVIYTDAETAPLVAE